VKKLHGDLRYLQLQISEYLPYVTMCGHGSEDQVEDQV
jgi:hypothetical protein